MALTYKSYKGSYGFGRESSSTAVFTCPWNERFSQKALLLGAYDANDANLRCNSVTVDYAGGDPTCGIAQLTCQFQASARVEAKTKNAQLKRRLEFSQENFTIKGKGFKWASGKPINNKNIQPMISYTITKIVLYGRRDQISLSSYDAYEKTVNADTFEGAPPGYVRFVGVTASESQLDDGSLVDDIEIILERRSIPWVQQWNEDTGAWEEVKEGTQPILSSVSYAPLRQAVTTP